MKTTVIISNYNYGRYVSGAIESVLGNEGEYLHEIIVVDDGSTDESREILSREYGENGKVKLVFKENGGQFSCFRRGIELATGDVICFLDPDDRYERQYFRRIAEVYEEKPYVDFVYVGYKDVGDRNQVVLKSKDSFEIGMMPISTALAGKLFGSLTSAISIRKALAKKLLAFPDFMDWDWVISADVPIEIGAIIAGAYRYYLAVPLMERTIHSDNATHVIGKDSIIESKVREARRRARVAYRETFKVNITDIDALKREFKSLPNKNKETLQDYLSAVQMMNAGIVKKMIATFNLLRHN
ncbi:MAG: glycosyltransferase family 2 protein [Chlorobiales bacterium]|nr:glycosyltransferase family 2 protein [Chlorobiales bacterium]